LGPCPLTASMVEPLSSFIDHCTAAGLTSGRVGIGDADVEAEAQPAAATMTGRRWALSPISEWPEIRVPRQRGLARRVKGGGSKSP
jgi:hypothetical protein